MNPDERRQVVERLAPIVREFLEQPSATRPAAAR
jgi:hypothetical protein